MRLTLILAFTAILLAVFGNGCGAPKHNSTTPTVATTPPQTFISTLTNCTSVTGPCASVDFSAAGNSIPKDLFGDGMEWQNYGNDIINPDLTNTTPGGLRSDILSMLSQVGYTVMRYPGGTLADMFHWQQSVGPMSSRTAQKTLNLDNSGNPILQLPYFGPDEFTSVAQTLGTSILLTVNLATGTATEAANWISHWKSQGVNVKYVEIGNETYIAGPGNSFSAVTASSYATSFNAYAQAIRAVDPNIKVGAIGTMDSYSWCLPNPGSCPAIPWNGVVLQNITQKIDFLAVHNSYAPMNSTTDLNTYTGMMGYPQFIAFDNGLIEADIQYFGGSLNKNIPIAITETSSFFIAPSNATQNQIIATLQNNLTLGSAIYSALVYNTFIKDSKVTLVNHINPQSSVWQAAVTTAIPGGAGYPARYSPQPTMSAFGLVFKAYRELASQKAVTVIQTNVPTFNAPAVGLGSAQNNVPQIDTIAAIGVGQGWIFLINRNLTSDLSTSIVFKNIPAQAQKIVIDQLTAPSYTSFNASGGSSPVKFQPVMTASLAGLSGPLGFTTTLPKASLYRIRIQ